MFLATSGRKSLMWSRKWLTSKRKYIYFDPDKKDKKNFDKKGGGDQIFSNRGDYPIL